MNHQVKLAAAFLPIALALTGCNDEPTAPTGDTTTSAEPADASVAKTAAEGVIRAIYGSYSQPGTADIPSASDRPVFSAGLKALIATIPHADGEMGPLDDADWFCGCQDWDPATAAVKSLTSTAQPDGKVTVESSFSAMANAESTNITYTLVNEGGSWLIDDMTMPGGESLRAQIAAIVEAEGQ